ncbi:MAG: hypothetical protein ABGZ53_28900 [Fuerstiella sp.]
MPLLLLRHRSYENNAGTHKALLLTDRLYVSLFLAQSGFYFVAAVNSRLKFRGQLGRVLHLPALFVTVNAALLVRLVRWLRNQQSGVWIRTPRTG